jgi:hypothetical protein
MNLLINLNPYLLVFKKLSYKNNMEKQLCGHYKTIFYILMPHNYFSTKKAASDSLCACLN